MDIIFRDYRPELIFPAAESEPAPKFVRALRMYDSHDLAVPDDGNLALIRAPREESRRLLHHLRQRRPPVVAINGQRCRPVPDGAALPRIPQLAPRHGLIHESAVLVHAVDALIPHLEASQALLQEIRRGHGDSPAFTQNVLLLQLYPPPTGMIPQNPLAVSRYAEKPVQARKI